MRTSDFYRNTEKNIATLAPIGFSVEQQEQLAKSIAEILKRWNNDFAFTGNISFHIYPVAVKRKLEVVHIIFQCIQY